MLNQRDPVDDPLSRLIAGGLDYYLKRHRRTVARQGGYLQDLSVHDPVANAESI